MDLTDIINIVETQWPTRYRRGRIQQVYTTWTGPGGTYRVSLTIQQIEETPPSGLELISRSFE